MRSFDSLKDFERIAFLHVDRRDRYLPMHLDRLENKPSFQKKSCIRKGTFLKESKVVTKDAKKTIGKNESKSPHHFTFAQNE